MMIISRLGCEVKKAVVILLFGLWIGSAAAHGAPQIPASERTEAVPLESSLVQAMKDYDAAQLHGDRAELERLVAPDYLIVRPRGIGDRTSLIDGMAHPGIKMEPFTVEKPFTRNYGATVITGGWAELKGQDGAERFDEKFRFADVWTKRSGRWFVVMTTLTPSEIP